MKLSFLLITHSCERLKSTSNELMRTNGEFVFSVITPLVIALKDVLESSCLLFLQTWRIVIFIILLFSISIFICCYTVCKGEGFSIVFDVFGRRHFYFGEKSFGYYFLYRYLRTWVKIEENFPFVFSLSPDSFDILIVFRVSLLRRSLSYSNFLASL